MKKLNLILFALCLLGFCAASQTLYAQNQTQQGESFKEMEKGDPMPDFTLVSKVYGDISSKDLKGKVVLVNLFATWCGPCQVELADVQSSLWPKLKDKKDFKLIVVGREHTDEELATYNEKKGFEFPLYPDPNRETYSKFADKTIPRAYLFGKDGKLIYSSVGYKKGDIEKVIDMINKAL